MPQPYLPVNMGYIAYLNKQDPSYTGLMTFDIQTCPICLMETQDAIILIHNDLPISVLHTALTNRFNDWGINLKTDIKRVTFGATPSQLYKPLFQEMVRFFKHQGITSLFYLDASARMSSRHLGIDKRGQLFNNGLLPQTYVPHDWTVQRQKRINILHKHDLFVQPRDIEPPALHRTLACIPATLTPIRSPTESTHPSYHTINPLMAYTCLFRL